MDTAYLNEITRVALTTDGITAVAAYFVGEALLPAVAFNLSALSDAAIIADIIARAPAPRRISPTAEFVITRDPGDGTAISVTTTTAL